MVIGRVTGGLDHKTVLAPDILENLDEDLQIGEPPDIGLGQRSGHASRDRFRQRSVAVASDQLHARLLSLDLPACGIPAPTTFHPETDPTAARKTGRTITGA